MLLKYIMGFLDSSWLWQHLNFQLFLTLFFPSLLVPLFIYGVVMKKRRSAGKQSLPPGPRGLPVVGYLPFLPQSIHSHLAELAETYGPIVSLRLGMKLYVVVSSPSLAKEILRDHDAIFANRDIPAVAHANVYGVGMLWSPYGPHWRMLRKVCVQEIFSAPRLNSSYKLRRREVCAAISRIYAMTGTPVDISQQASLVAMNVMTSTMWGGESGAEENSMKELQSKFHKVAGEVLHVTGKANISDFFPFLARLDLQGLVRGSNEMFKWLDEIFDSLIDRRLKKEQGKNGDIKDFLQVLLNIVSGCPDSENPFTLTHLKALLLDMLVGGSATTATSIEWAMAMLIQHPHILRRSQQEVDEVVGRNNAVEETHIPHLPYLNAVLKEVMRLYPAAPLLVPHSPSQACSVGGYLVPKGSRILVNTWAMHRDPLTWEEPLKFNPERFLCDEDDDVKRRDFKGNDFSYLPFGSGRRSCVGLPMAERLVPYILASFLHSFDWKLTEGSKLDFSAKLGLELKKAVPLTAIPSPRLANAELYSLQQK